MKKINMKENYKPFDGMRHVSFGEKELEAVLEARSYNAVVMDRLEEGFSVLIIIKDNDLPQFLRKIGSQMRMETLKIRDKEEQEKWKKLVEEKI